MQYVRSYVMWKANILISAFTPPKIQFKEHIDMNAEDKVDELKFEKLELQRELPELSKKTGEIPGRICIT